jgi:hypothetical protein
MSIGLLQNLDLVGGKMASIDGTKIKVWNSRKGYYNAAKLACILKRMDKESERTQRQ